MAGRLASIASRMDRLYEFDREPVSPDKLQSGGRFAGLFAGEHVAATEFVIGAFFVLHGVTARDLFVGLLSGNLLAVLSWTFICAPIAVRTRLTLYWYLRKIAGPGLTIMSSSNPSCRFFLIFHLCLRLASFSLRCPGWLPGTCRPPGRVASRPHCSPAAAGLP